MALMKGITCCGDCVYYSMKKHRCTRGACKEENPRNPFYEDCPLPDVAPVVHGRWEEKEDGWGGYYYDCSACGESWTIIDGTPTENNMTYCPKCGARMGGCADV